MNADGYSDEFGGLIYSQNAIGWRQIFNGKWSGKWAEIQGQYRGETMEHDMSVVGDKWNVTIIQEIWEQ
jgi:hypothetical protein